VLMLQHFAVVVDYCTPGFDARHDHRPSCWPCFLHDVTGSPCSPGIPIVSLVATTSFLGSGRFLTILRFVNLFDLYRGGLNFAVFT